jgi:hypothetical protein
MKQHGNLDKQVQQRADNDAVYQAINTVNRDEEDCAQYLAKVIGRRRQTGHQEVLVGLQTRHHQAADGENNRRNQVEAHQVGQQIELFGWEARRNHLRGNLLGKNGNQYRNAAGDDKTQVGNPREQIPGGGAVFVGQVFGQERDEGHRQRATRNQGKKHVGQVVGGVKGIEQVNVITVLARNDADMHKSQKFVEGKQRDDQQGVETGAGEFEFGEQRVHSLPYVPELKTNIAMIPDCEVCKRGGIPVISSRIWWCGRAYARPHHQIRPSSPRRAPGQAGKYQRTGKH